MVLTQNHKYKLMLTGLLTLLVSLCSFPFPHAQASQTAIQPKYALLVGISKYKDQSLNQIDGCENNVPLLAQTLIDNYGFQSGDVHTLMNERAGKAAILAEFRTHL